MLRPFGAMKEADSSDREWAASADQEASDQPKSSTTPVVWSVNIEGKQVVDMSHVDLVERVRDGRVPLGSLLWREGMSDWRALDQFPEFETVVSQRKANDSGLRPRPDDAGPTATVGTDATPTHIGSVAATTSAIPREVGDDEDSNEVTRVFGALAVYERPLATLEFSPAAEQSRDEEPPASDALTPIQVPRKRTAPPRPGPQRSDRPPPPLPALRKAVHGKAETPPNGASQPEVAANVAARPETPSNGAISQPKVEAKAPPEPPAADAEVLGAHEVVAAPAPSIPPPPPLPSAQLPAPAIPDDVPPPPSSVITPPRPALASLPLIIVREAPSSPGDIVSTPAPVPLDESTLVLGRRKTHRWVPLRAAIVSAFGAACLASVLTWSIVRPVRALRAPAPTAATPVANIAPSPESTAPSAPAEAAASSDSVRAAEPIPAPEGATPEEATAPAKPEGAEALTKPRKASSGARARKAPSERASESSDGASRESFGSGLGDANKAEAPKSAPEAAPATPATATQRAGFPSNPGF